MSGNIIKEFINSCSALRKPHLRLEKEYHKPNHLSSFQQRRRLFILCFGLQGFEDRCQNKNNKILMVFSFLICQLKISYPESRILSVRQMSLFRTFLLAVISEEFFSL